MVADHEQKAKDLARRVFPNPSANLADVEDQAFLGDWEPGLDIPRKVIEAVVTRKITQAAEANVLLPDEQMGNRAHRSTELAMRLVVAQVQEA